MITANNLLKSGFMPQGKVIIDNDGWYQDWIKVIKDHPLILIEVCEQKDAFHPALVVGHGLCSENIPLNITSVSDLLTLAKLLK